MATGRLPDPNSAPVTAKGDLYTYSTVPAKLAVGSDGETLVADSSTSTGLRWGNNYGFTAGKNKIINGDFRINQRGLTSTTNAGYGFDRWSYNGFGGTLTMSAQTFTPGSAPVAGYEAVNFLRIATTGQTTQGQYTYAEQRIEDVRTFANQTATVSFWAKASSGTPFLWLEFQQSFGSGGSGTNVGQIGSSITLSTTWTRYTATVNIPSISGATIGTGSFLDLIFWTSVGSSVRAYTNATFQNATIDIWGVQFEAGSVATAFQTATGTLAGELAACQRYYQRWSSAANNALLPQYGSAVSTTSINHCLGNMVTMRVAPTSIEFSNIQWSPDNLSTSIIPTTLTLSGINTESAIFVNSTVSGATQYRPYRLFSSSSAGFVGISAEL